MAGRPTAPPTGREYNLIAAFKIPDDAKVTALEKKTMLRMITLPGIDPRADFDALLSAARLTILSDKTRKLVDKLERQLERAEEGEEFDKALVAYNRQTSIYAGLLMRIRTVMTSLNGTPSARARNNVKESSKMIDVTPVEDEDLLIG